jgi:hypothetical protein
LRATEIAIAVEFRSRIIRKLKKERTQAVNEKSNRQGDVKLPTRFETRCLNLTPNVPMNIGYVGGVRIPLKKCTVGRYHYDAGHVPIDTPQ